jgi:hypothetical protein
VVAGYTGSGQVIKKDSVSNNIKFGNNIKKPEVNI